MHDRGLQVGRKVWWPVLGLMRDTIFGEPIASTLAGMEERSITKASQSQKTAEPPVQSKKTRKRHIDD